VYEESLPELLEAIIELTNKGGEVVGEDVVGEDVVGEEAKREDGIGTAENPDFIFPFSSMTLLKGR
jgi:hypothetical protein